MPPQDWATTTNPNLVVLLKKRLARQGFHETVSKLISSMNMRHMELGLGNLIVDKMEVNGNMFHPEMKNRVGTQVVPTLSQLMVEVLMET